MTGADIRAFRERHGLTAEAMGKLVEPPVARQEVSKMETGKRPVGAGMAARVREAMRKLEAEGRR